MLKKTLFLLPILLWNTQGVSAQIDDSFVRDSIEIERGISGTTEFEPFFRIINETFDENNRPLQSVVYRYTSPTELAPRQRQTFQYDDDGNTTYFLLEDWDESGETWVPVKQEDSSYDNGRLSTMVRKVAVQGELQNHRRWTYEYTAQGSETLKLLEGWDSDTETWGGLSRKITNYTVDDQISLQLLQSFAGMNWKNSRRRMWTWEDGQLQPTETLSQIWLNANEEWQNSSRKTFYMGGNGLWSGSIVEAWNETTSEWVNDVKEAFEFDLANSTSNYTLELWEGEWLSNFRSQYTFNATENMAVLQRWNTEEMQHDDFLRYSSLFNNDRLPVEQTGMQLWNADAGSWQNEDFTRRISYFWRSSDPSNIEEISNNYCRVPNPYFSGATISCELSTQNFPLRLEVYNLYGQVVLQKQVHSPSFQADMGSLSSGMYVFKLSDERQVYQLQKVVVAN